MAYAAPPDYCRFNTVPLSALRMTSRKILSKYLNLEAMVPADNSYLPDYRGLAEMLGYDYLEIRNFGNVPDHMGDLLDDWLKGGQVNPTVGKLLSLISDLGRVDVLHEVMPVVEKDVEVWQQKQAELKRYVPVQDETVSQSSHDHSVDEFEYMTNDDVKNRTPTHYSAFVCSAIEDISFVKEMIENLEGKFGLHLCVPVRDMLPGGSANTVSARLIEQRCTKMVVVLSPNFLKSPECDFQIKVAQAISPGARSKKVIPVLKEMCQLPNILRHITLCDYTKSDLKEWFWKRLANSVEMPVQQGADVSVEKLSHIKLPRSDSSEPNSWSSSSTTSSNRSSESALHASRC